MQPTGEKTGGKIRKPRGEHYDALDTLATPGRAVGG
ncbi:hypothetical protein J2S55_008751 [Streptosporangium brasiliense]|uniref:Uncharacterized protein n=1 Tax=Streptosporangium brasiliense TaxID=47480 RepID=A0ABT9RM99_9ACTN|nr:hypothetical protein [Streptosporangium brasiliense]